MVQLKSMFFALALLMFIGKGAEAAQLKKTTLEVKNLSCGSCLSKIGVELRDLPDAISMGADLRQGLVFVLHRPGLAAEEIAARISAIGYPAVVLAADSVEVEGAGAAEHLKTSAGDVTRTTFQVENLACGSCLAKIDFVLREGKGVVDIGADLARKLVFVKHPASLSPQEIASAITEIGYPARVLSKAEVEAFSAPSPDSGFRFAQTDKAGGCGSGARCCTATSSTWKKFYNRFIQ